MPSHRDNDAAASCCEAGRSTPQGAFVLEQEKKLAAGMVSAWPRRNASLLELGCGAGHFLELFWEAGFDVAGVDISQRMLDAARKRMGGKAALHFANASRLPFEDNAFAYAAFVVSLECMEEPDSALAEAFRVASRGVIVIFLNKWSLHWLEQRIQAAGSGVSAPFPRRLSPLAAWKRLHRLGGACPVVCRSMLLTPSCCWRAASHIPRLPVWQGGLPIGALVGMRVDTTPLGMTPLTLTLGKAAPAMQ
jgi:SAM-dependent methyltransferase